MFGMGKKRLVTEVAEVPATVKPEAVLVGNELAEYSHLADSIGWAPGCILDQKVKIFLAENNICVYPLAKVRDYLDKQFGVHNYHATWCWCPLRKDDRDANLHNQHESHRNGHIVDNRRYHGQVPMPVLVTVEKIHHAFPDVHFYVSDAMQREDGDPFLAITAVGMEMLVVERWNEPSFRM